MTWLEVTSDGSIWLDVRAQNCQSEKVVEATQEVALEVYSPSHQIKERGELTKYHEKGENRGNVKLTSPDSIFFKCSFRVTTQK